MLKILIIIVLSLAATSGGATWESSDSRLDISKITIDYFNRQSDDFYKAANELFLTIKSLDQHDERSLQHAKNSLVQCRMNYKRISFFLDYFFPQQAWTYNTPSKYEVEEPFMEWDEPHGLQFIEEMLFSADVFKNNTAILAQAQVIQESARDLKNLLYQYTFTDAQLFESLQLELIRIMSLYIAGYDAPKLKSGLLESIEALYTIKYLVSSFYPKVPKDQFIESMDLAIQYLKTNPDFNTFNRLDFITNYSLPLEKQLNAFILKNNLAEGALLNNSAFNLFKWSTIDSSKSDSIISRLGEKLFKDKRLSGDFSRACSSCHEPEKYFTDGLATNLSLGSGLSLLRNTPTLYYAAHQSTQFWDGRAKSLEAQVLEVLTNPKEMNADPRQISLRLNNDTDYKKHFSEVFGMSLEDSPTLHQVSTAIAKYVETLSPMNADFDHYINGDKTALSPSQIRGFNLFMGKAQCGTCHFIPFFNGSTPPNYNRSEYEVIGIPATDNIQNPKRDKDPGRFNYFPAPFYQGAFKTPTLRNIAKTAPYMHNGQFQTLEQVMEFYNRGGGRGIGMNITNQTLSEKPLQLSKSEMDEIILFLNSLTDQNSSSAVSQPSR